MRATNGRNLKIDRFFDGDFSCDPLRSMRFIVIFSEKSKNDQKKGDLEGIRIVLCVGNF